MSREGCGAIHPQNCGNCPCGAQRPQFDHDLSPTQRCPCGLSRAVFSAHMADYCKLGPGYSPSAALGTKAAQGAPHDTHCLVADRAYPRVAAASSALAVLHSCTDSRIACGTPSHAGSQPVALSHVPGAFDRQHVLGDPHVNLKQRPQQRQQIGTCSCGAGCRPHVPARPRMSACCGLMPSPLPSVSTGWQPPCPSGRPSVKHKQQAEQHQQDLTILIARRPAAAELCASVPCAPTVATAVAAVIEVPARLGRTTATCGQAYENTTPHLQEPRRPAARCAGTQPRRMPPLVLAVLLLLAAAHGRIGPLPCAAAEWSWIWGKSKAASLAVGGPGGAPTASWSFYGLIPYGWRKHLGSAGSEGHGGGSGSAIGSGRSSSSRSRSGTSGSSGSGSSSSSSSSSSSRDRGSGRRGGQTSSHGFANVAGTGGAAAGVIFTGGRVSVAVNPGGNETELMEYNPYTPPPAPPNPAPPGATGKKGRKPKYRAQDDSPPRTLSDAELALRELLLSKRLPFDPMKPYKLPPASYKSSDFVFATGSFPARYILAQSTRSWRRGIRAFIAVNNTADLELLNEKNKIHHERYEYFPDDGTGDLGPVYHGYMAGDTRAAMAPFLAHQYFGETYKWMLYGDDDTLFYMPSVKRLLAHLDPELPIAISDNLWFRARHPNLFAPRCLPCHLAVDADPPAPSPEEVAAAEAAGAPVPEAKVLRIPNITAVLDGYQRFLLGVRSAADFESAKVQKLMTKNTFGDFNKSLHAIAPLPPDASVPGVRYLPRPACPFCTAAAACTPTPPPVINVTGAGCFASGGHGGAGMIFSVGLLRRLHPDRMKKCYMKIIKAPGGDGMLSACLWEAGYAFTDPGASTLARYDGNYLLFSTEAGKWALHDPLAVLLRGKCDARCKWLLRNAATHHGRGRHFQNFEQSAAYLYANMASYTATHKWLAFMAGRDDDLAELGALSEGRAAGQEGGGAGARKEGGEEAR